MSAAAPSTGVDPIRLSLAIRAYAQPVLAKKAKRGAQIERPSEWVLVFDTETTTDPGQALRFGTYQVRKAETLYEAGLFYRPEVMPVAEVELLTIYAAQHGLKLRTQAEFVDEVFYEIGYDLRATIVGFNLPFDVSRLAIRYGSARKSMRGGFTFTLSQDKRRPAVRIKHLSRRVSFFKFATPFQQRTGRSDRKRGRKRPARSGFFLDVNTLAHALLSRSFNLGSLADHLGSESRKAGTNDHGGPLTAEYVTYALQDTQVTWECYRELVGRYGKLQLRTPVHRIYSEASLGKATLDAMGVRPWREIQPDVPPALLGIVLSTYYGGRSEVRIRRELRQVVLCDFLSMYPTVCTLMNLWRFITAKGMTWHDDTQAVRAFVESITLAKLQQRESWCDLSVLVQIDPTDDIVPVRADYDGTGSTTIGLNYLTSEQPLWLTLADCIAAKLLNNCSPRIIRAIRFSPLAMQGGLRPTNVNGNHEHQIDPQHGDFYKQLIELRQSIKSQLRDAHRNHKDHLETLQHALKITANATSYGIFAEVNVEELREPRTVEVNGAAETPFQVQTRKIEKPGAFFHPLVATLITGAARLMLAITENLVSDAGLEWAFCDTDSMAIARPASLDQATFQSKVDAVVEWFTALNPYNFAGSLLKIEDVNTRLANAKQRDDLFCYAVSAKRYALFNLDKDGLPVLRKASAHGLGHLREPYNAGNPATGIPSPIVQVDKIGVALWQHDLWWMIARAAVCGPVVELPLDHHPAMEAPAVSRYAATTPEIHRWFRHYNEGRSHDDQVKPFGFLLAFSAVSGSHRQPVSPFDRDHAKAAKAVFDRTTAKPIEAIELQSYRASLAQYHLSPESKFLNGDYLDSGLTLRRHVVARGQTHIGKEANRWEEQFFLGHEAKALVAYGAAPSVRESLVVELATAKESVGERQLASRLGYARETLRGMLLHGSIFGSDQLWSSVEPRIEQFWVEQRRDREQRDQALVVLASWVDRDGPTAVAERLGVNTSNMIAVIRGRRQLNNRLRSIIAAHSTNL